MRRLIFISLVVIALSGCSALSHLNELFALKAIGDEQKAMDREVEKQDKKFKLLIEEIQKGNIKEYPNKKSVARRFGEPVLSEQVDKDGVLKELWIYRYSAKFFDSDKAYLYFDPSGNLINWQYVPGLTTK